MTHIIIENCIKCKYTDCILVCPVDCFCEGKNFLVIDPNICIDCGVCIPECPVESIISDDDLNKNNFLFKKINYELSKIWDFIILKKNIKNKNKWKNIKNKLHLINL